MCLKGSTFPQEEIPGVARGNALELANFRSLTTTRRVSFSLSLSWYEQFFMYLNKVHINPIEPLIPQYLETDWFGAFGWLIKNNIAIFQIKDIFISKPIKGLLVTKSSISFGKEQPTRQCNQKLGFGVIYFSSPVIHALHVWPRINIVRILCKR